MTISRGYPMGGAKQCQPPGEVKCMQRKLTILVPGDTVSGIETEDAKDSDQAHETVQRRL